MEQLLASPAIELVETDVAFGPRTQVICDAHALPFADSTFDGVIIQAVLQYVQDPQAVITEIHRVLGESGVVYAEVPFMQHGLEGYDFNRFTILGLRRLFRSFEEVSADTLVGPATMMSWSLQYFFLSFVSGRAARAVTKGATRLVFAWLKHLDRLLIERPGAVDAANELAFLGTKSDETLSDRELARAHRKFW
jgi:ubiquinone/menaquinone biosynthesis C-methylase UbiE